MEVFVNVAATGEHPAGAFKVNEAVGFGKTVTVVVLVSVQPAGVLAVKLIVYTLFIVNVFVNVSKGFVRSYVVPFPKSQLQEVAFDDVFVKFTDRVGQPFIGVKVKSAVGFIFTKKLC